jgi:hypothetical protein
VESSVEQVPNAASRSSSKAWTVSNVNGVLASPEYRPRNKSATRELKLKAFGPRFEYFIAELRASFANVTAETPIINIEVLSDSSRVSGTRPAKIVSRV